MECEFSIENLRKLIYWITLKFKEDEFHHQASSAKSDLIGGFYDRWFNRAPEFLIFNKLLKDKNYDVVIDNFFYGQDTKKNAPDIIGLQDKKGNIIVKFASFKDGDWQSIKDRPMIEVKTFRVTQSLSAVGETQMDDEKYYVFVESNVRPDYLTALFEKSVFSQKIFNSLKTSKEFIESDSNNQIIIPKPLMVKKELGHFKLLGIFKGSEIKKYSLLVGIDFNGNPEKPKYFSSVEETNPVDNINEEVQEGAYSCSEDCIPFYIGLIDKKSKISLVKKLKSYIVLKIKGKVSVNGSEISDGYYRVNFKKFDRSSKKKEYVGDKHLFEYFAEDVTKQLIKNFDVLFKKNDNYKI